MKVESGLVFHSIASLGKEIRDFSTISLNNSDTVITIVSYWEDSNLYMYSSDQISRKQSNAVLDLKDQAHHDEIV